MEEEARNLAAVQRAWDAFNAQPVTTAAIRRGEFAPVFDVFDPAVVWDATAVGVAGLEKFHGHDGIRKFWLDWFEVVGDVHTEVREIAAAGDKVVTICHQSGSGKASGAAVAWDFAMVFTMRDAKAVHIELSLDLDRARRLAGLDSAAPTSG